VEFCHGKRPRPQKPLKLQRKKRCDAGKVKRSMATLLSGVILSHKEEKAILNNNSYDIKITEKGNSIPITNCTQLEEAPDHPSQKYKRKEEISSKNLKIRFASQDAVQNVDDIHKGEPWQDPEVQVNDNHACESENFVLSGKDCSKQGSKFKEVVESRMDGHQEVSIYDTHYSGWQTPAHYICYFDSYKSHQNIVCILDSRWQLCDNFEAFILKISTLFYVGYYNKVAGSVLDVPDSASNRNGIQTSS
jgi:hypothetical protein